VNLSITGKHYDTVYLGESFSNIVNIFAKANRQRCCIVDIWDGGSLFHGVDIGDFCVDRVPMHVNKPINTLLGEYVEYVRFKPDIEFLGTETSYENKVSKGIQLQRNWFLELSSGGYIPKKFWCKVFRDLKRKVSVARYYGEIKKANLERRLIAVSYEREVLTYDKLVISLPLPYIINKLNLRVNGESFKYVSLFINLLIIDNYVGENKVIYVGKTHVVPHTIIIINLSDFNERLSNYALVYVMSSVKHPYVDIKGEFFERILVDVKRLGIVNVGNIKAYRVFMEKYGLLGILDDKAVDVLNTLRGYDVVLLGRLGSWKEVSINDLLTHVQV